LAALIEQKNTIPTRTISITFDDGYRDNYTYAFPILKKYGLPATVFIIVNEVGRLDRLSWDEIKEMQDSGIITFGSHTLGPEPLIKISSKAELRKHMSAKDAAYVATAADAGRLILTHFSQRYKTLEELEEEAKLHFQDTVCAYDFMKIIL